MLEGKESIGSKEAWEMARYLAWLDNKKGLLHQDHEWAAIVLEPRVSEPPEDLADIAETHRR